MTRNRTPCMPRRWYDKNDRLWTGLGLAWLIGVVVIALLILLPLKMPFLDAGVGSSLTFGDLSHFLAFFFLAGVFPLAFPNRLLSLLAPIMLAQLCFLLEIWQFQVPHRHFSETDIKAGLLGCLVGTVLGWCLRMWRRHKAHTSKD